MLLNAIYFILTHAAHHCYFFQNLLNRKQLAKERKIAEDEATNNRKRSSSSSSKIRATQSIHPNPIPTHSSNNSSPSATTSRRHRASGPIKRTSSLPSRRTPLTPPTRPNNSCMDVSLVAVTAERLVTAERCSQDVEGQPRGASKIADMIFTAVNVI
jgi:hypothetical protein